MESIRALIVHLTVRQIFPFRASHTRQKDSKSRSSEICDIRVARRFLILRPGRYHVIPFKCYLILDLPTKDSLIFCIKGKVGMSIIEMHWFLRDKTVNTWIAEKDRNNVRFIRDLIAFQWKVITKERTFDSWQSYLGAVSWSLFFLSLAPR